MISRSFFRQSAAFLWLSLCILTDSTPRMACNAQHPAPQATPPARPRRARGEEERERHGQTATARPRSCTGQPSTLHNPSDTATACTCTGWERQGRGREGKERGARQNSPAPRRQSHIYRTDAPPAPAQPRRTPSRCPSCCLLSSCARCRAILLLESLQNPSPLKPRLQTVNTCPPACSAYRHRGSLYISNVPVNFTN